MIWTIILDSVRVKHQRVVVAAWYSRLKPITTFFVLHTPGLETNCLSSYVIESVEGRIPEDRLAQRWSSAEPTSKTLAQHWPNCWATFSGISLY